MVDNIRIAIILLYVLPRSPQRRPLPILWKPHGALVCLGIVGKERMQSLFPASLGRNVPKKEIQYCEDSVHSVVVELNVGQSGILLGNGRFEGEHFRKEPPKCASTRGMAALLQFGLPQALKALPET